MKFTLLRASGGSEEVCVNVRKMINAGYTGRDQEAVRAHIDELKEEGIPAPDKTPTYFPKFVDRITQDEAFEVLDESDHSGEAEFALIFDKGRIYVGAGSDHTDRKLETVDIPKAKQVYPNTISRELWLLDDVRGHWDELVLRSWVTPVGGKRTLLQDATLDAMLSPDELVERVKAILVDPKDLDGLVIYSGTVAAITKVEYCDSFEVVIEDKKLGRSLKQFYKMHPTKKWFKG
ncbi:DUF2848 domain-containing protein [Synergistaceae bacterium OttesenSCG-928-I11]|nr:DUF2848 domain-containing protein [Synergistaceae bacterium OttesenSCG-928-I11]